MDERACSKMAARQTRSLTRRSCLRPFIQMSISVSPQGWPRSKKVEIPPN